MRKFNPEVHRDNIRKVDRVPESEWTMVQRKLEHSSSNFIPCNKNSCKSRIHNAARCWWTHPELRSNILNSSCRKKGSEIEKINQKMDKGLIPSVSAYRSKAYLPF